MKREIHNVELQIQYLLYLAQSAKKESELPWQWWTATTGRAEQKEEVSIIKAKRLRGGSLYSLDADL